MSKCLLSHVNACKRTYTHMNIHAYIQKYRHTIKYIYKSVSLCNDMFANLNFYNLQFLHIRIMSSHVCQHYMIVFLFVRTWYGIGYQLSGCRKNNDKMCLNKLTRSTCCNSQLLKDFFSCCASAQRGMRCAMFTFHL